MPPSSISRGPITSRLLAELATEGFPVGDNATPMVAYGWTGEPNTPGLTFTPWLSLSPGAAVLQAPAGALGDTQTEWRLSYHGHLCRTEPEADRGTG